MKERILNATMPFAAFGICAVIAITAIAIFVMWCLLDVFTSKHPVKSS